MVVPTIAVTPAVQAFDTVKVGKQSPPQTFTITNLGMYASMRGETLEEFMRTRRVWEER